MAKIALDGDQVNVSPFSASTVSKVNVTESGSNYNPENPPTVEFSGGGGSGASGVANVNNDGTIGSITVTNSGSGYTSAPTVDIDAPTSGVQAQATAILGPVIASADPTRDFLKIDGKPVLIQGDSVSEHINTAPNPDDIHAGATMTTSQSFVTINGIPIVVDGDNASCDDSHTINATGSVTIT